jgi:hypothetical protein
LFFSSFFVYFFFSCLLQGASSSRGSQLGLSVGHLPAPPPPPSAGGAASPALDKKSGSKYKSKAKQSSRADMRKKVSFNSLKAGFFSFLFFSAQTVSKDGVLRECAYFCQKTVC